MNSQIFTCTLSQNNISFFEGVFFRTGHNFLSNKLFLNIIIVAPLLLTGFLWDSPDGQRDELSFVTKGTPSLGAGTGELSQELMQALEGVGRQPRGQTRARGLRVSDETVIAKSRHRTPKGVSTKKPRATSHLRLRDVKWSENFFKMLGGGGLEIGASRDRASGRGRSSSSSSPSSSAFDARAHLLGKKKCILGC